MAAGRFAGSVALAMEPYSYRADPLVPPFDDRHPIVFMDGECALCTRAARTIARLDKAEEFRICPIQTPLGRAILCHYDMNPGDPATWLYLENGVAHGSMEGVVRAGRRMGGIARLTALLLILPRPVRDSLYNCIVRTRYRLFGRADMCGIPDAALRKRLLT